MSCSPTTRPEVASPDALMIDVEDQLTIRDGNRVLRSIAQHETMRALLAFSELHGQIHRDLDPTHAEPAKDLLQTEHFILDEVLQLLCDRALTITSAESVVVALIQQSDLETAELVCRAAAGPFSVSRGTRANLESEFLRTGMASGSIQRCDDSTIDARVALDLTKQLGARSTVLVPLRGRHQQIGILQAFSKNAAAFGDSDVKGLELLAELVLAALKPEDQDRRLQWLSDVAADVLEPKSAEETIEPIILQHEISLQSKSADLLAPLAQALTSGAAPSAAVDASENILSDDSDQILTIEAEEPPATTPAMEPEQLTLLALEERLPGNVKADANTETVQAELYDSAVIETTSEKTGIPAEPVPAVPGSVNRFNSRTGLKLVTALAVVALLFSAGAWWGMHSRLSGQEAAGAKAESDSLPQAVTAPAPPRADMSAPDTDNLLSNAKVETPASSQVTAGSEKLAALPKITGLRHWSSSLGSTVVIDMEDQVPYEVHRLMSPERIYFDLHDTFLSRELDGKTMDVGDVALSRVRIAQPTAGLTRIVLDTKDGSNFSVSMEANPYRLVIELRGDKTPAGNRSPKNGLAGTAVGKSVSLPAAGTGSVASLAKPTLDLLSPKATSSSTSSTAGRLRIVLDAGHGGWDLGTVGRQGLLEKDLVLDVTQRLGKLLQDRIGADVKLTRDSDEYLPLEQRSDLANQAQADLFVSIHANYSSSASARGVETYYSNLFAAPGSKETEKPNDGNAAKLMPVSLSLGGLHEKIEESRKLAVSVQRSLYSTLAANSPEIRNRGIKYADFVVLNGTTMPSILTEISFVSSPEDERKLQSATYRQQIAEALFQGIARYRQASSHVKLAQLQTAAVRR